jgi:hypothetical protein
VLGVHLIARICGRVVDTWATVHDVAATPVSREDAVLALASTQDVG